MTTLSDRDVRLFMDKGDLIKNGDKKYLSGACYELRMGNVYYDLTESDKPISVPTGGTVLIKPGHRVVLITHEELAVPGDVLARIVSKGSLFSVGLSPVATYADPGFSGNMGIVTQNVSDKYIVLPLLEPIAKVDFTILSSLAVRPYAGQHGFRTQIWPIKHQLQKTHSEISDDERVGSEKEESYKVIPQATADVLRSIERRQSIVDFSILGLVLLNVASILLVGEEVISHIIGFVVNLLATGVVGLVMLYSNRKK